ncbi:MAG: lysophospholipase [Simkaniaceae bacterium]|nr:lysophospholipase [Simkaniaceae bacterium]MCF7852987.1 lysophospholipase [Simkaniaceae bacterium]
MKKFFGFIIIAIVAATVTIAGNLYFTQERRIFGFSTLPLDHQFRWEMPHKEIMLDTPNEGKINAILFETTRETPKGVIFYCHGKASHMDHPKWGPVIENYTNLGFDFFMMDYRGAGKSSGKQSEEAMLTDCNVAYQYLLDYYKEESITVFGKSLGTCFATYVASQNNPRALIIEAPFYNIFDIGCKTLYFIPPLLIKLVMKYPFTTNEWIKDVPCPIYIIHGTSDSIIPHDASLRLKKITDETNQQTDLMIIENGDHDHLHKYPGYHAKIEEALGISTSQTQENISQSELDGSNPLVNDIGN